MKIDPKIEAQIKEMFEKNYEALKLEGGHALTEDVLKAAYEQILYYYRKMHSVAEKITETEVKLTLPNQTTPQGHPFTIEGVVDIVREEDEVWMYDIKTHEPDFIRGNVEEYRKQLNVYAYIYQNLREQRLDHTAIISTAFPRELKMALISGDSKRIETEMKRWDPMIDIPYDQKKVEQTIQDFANVVNKIENCCFEPAPISTLEKKIAGTNTTFATRVCRNCDARFSCDSYRKFAAKAGRRTQSKYFIDYASDLDQEEFITANINIERIDNQKDVEENIER